MKKILVFAGFMGLFVMAGANATDPIQVATVKHVRTQAASVSTVLDAVEDAATADATSNTTNGTAITTMQTDRQPTASNTPCSQFNANEHSGCGYISTGGPNGTKQWVLIAKTPASSGN